MRLLLKAMCLWGLYDSIALARNPKGWDRFWTKKLDVISDSVPLTRTIAALQAVVCLAMLKRL